MQEPKNNLEENNVKKKNNRTLTNVLLIVLIVLVILLMMLRCCGQSTTVHEFNPTTAPTSEPTPTPMPDGPIDGTGYINEGEEYDPEAIKEKLNASQNSCSINASNYVEFANKYSEGEIKLKNLNDFYIQVSILPYDDEVVDVSKAYFTSIVIGPGEEMNKIKLTKNLGNLRKGVQPCLLYYDCFVKNDDGSYKRIGNCGLKISVNVMSVN